MRNRADRNALAQGDEELAQSEKVTIEEAQRRHRSVYKYVCIHIHMHIHICSMYTCIYMCMNACIYTKVMIEECVYEHTCMYMCIDRRMCV